jgi:endo-1,4-beta-xylanase
MAYLITPNTANSSMGRNFGTSIMRPQIEQNAAYADLVLQNAAILVPENELKWARIRATPNGYDFHDADWIVNYAYNKGKKVYGHTLVWGLTHPAWVNTFLSGATETEAYDLMIDHITTLVGRYKGRIRSWDVVNEPILTWDGRADGLRVTSNPWLAALSKGYAESATSFIKVAFDAAREADPSARLLLNQNYLEYPGTDEGGAGLYNGMRARFLDLLDELDRLGAPVDAVGIQGHLETVHTAFNATSFANFLSEVAARNVDIVITEMDVKDTNLSADIALRDQEVAAQYAEFLDVCLDQRAVKEVIMWAIADQYSWLNDLPSAERPDDLPLRPLLFDGSLQPKAAYAAVQQRVRRLR